MLALLRGESRLFLCIFKMKFYLLFYDTVCQKSNSEIKTYGKEVVLTARCWYCKKRFHLKDPERVRNIRLGEHLGPNYLFIKR